MWLAALIPVATGIILYLKFKHETLWWEFLIPFLASLLLILGSKAGLGVMQTQDTEWWGAYAKKVTYYEDWDEYIHKTCSEESCTGSGEDEVCTTTYYDCSYVEHYPPKIVYLDNIGSEHTLGVPYDDCEEEEGRLLGGWHKFTRSGNCGSPRFDELSKRWGNSEFKEMNRPAHSDDGDAYVTKWDGQVPSIEPIITRHTYKNKVQASDSVFNFRPVAEEDQQTYGLIPYPEFSSFIGVKAPSILGVGHPQRDEANALLTIHNARLGAGKQVRMLVILFKGQPRDAGLYQESFWKGSNKNEFVVTIGLDASNNIQWEHVFSWTEVDTVKINVRNWLGEREGQPLDLVALVNYMVPEVAASFERKEFSDFDYLTVEPPLWSVFTVFLITLLLNIGLSWWIVANEHHEGRWNWRKRGW